MIEAWGIWYLEMQQVVRGLGDMLHRCVKALLGQNHGKLTYFWRPLDPQRSPINIIKSAPSLSTGLKAPILVKNFPRHRYISRRHYWYWLIGDTDKTKLRRLNKPLCSVKWVLINTWWSPGYGSCWGTVISSPMEMWRAVNYLNWVLNAKTSLNCTLLSLIYSKIMPQTKFLNT